MHLDRALHALPTSVPQHARWHWKLCVHIDHITLFATSIDSSCVEVRDDVSCVMCIKGSIYVDEK